MKAKKGEREEEEAGDWPRQTYESNRFMEKERRRENKMKTHQKGKKSEEEDGERQKTAGRNG